jgi:hypothetical protein
LGQRHLPARCRQKTAESRTANGWDNTKLAELQDDGRIAGTAESAIGAETDEGERESNSGAEEEPESHVQQAIR